MSHEHHHHHHEEERRREEEHRRHEEHRQEQERRRQEHRQHQQMRRQQQARQHQMRREQERRQHEERRRIQQIRRQQQIRLSQELRAQEEMRRFEQARRVEQVRRLQQMRIIEGRMGNPLVEARIEAVQLGIAAIDLNMGERDLAIGARQMELGAVQMAEGNRVVGREMMELGAVEMGVGLERIKMGEQIREEVIISQNMYAMNEQMQMMNQPIYNNNMQMNAMYQNQRMAQQQARVNQQREQQMRNQQMLNQQMLDQQRLNQQRMNQNPNQMNQNYPQQIYQQPIQPNQGKTIFQDKIYQFNQGRWNQVIGTLTLQGFLNINIQKLIKLKVKCQSPIAGTKAIKLTFDGIGDIMIATRVEHHAQWMCQLIWARLNSIGRVCNLYEPFLGCIEGEVARKSFILGWELRFGSLTTANFKFSNMRGDIPSHIIASVPQIWTRFDFIHGNMLIVKMHSGGRKHQIGIPLGNCISWLKGLYCLIRY